MATETCTVQIGKNGSVTMDFSGSFEGSCCGCPSRAFTERLSQLGVRLDVTRVACRLPTVERVKAQSDGRCIISKPHHLEEL